MPATPSGAAVRSAAFVSTLLLSTAFTAPAFAQIETVIVTAERKAEDIQTVPLAVTALSSADLKSKQVNSFRDLQFHVPSVTYTKSNFGGAQFQIRGITTQFGLGAAIAQNINDVYIEAPNLVVGTYFDVDRVEVSRGPQSTSYGRAATGGAVNVITSKPDLDEFSARTNLDLGTYGTIKPEGMVNIPIIDGELGIRIAAIGDWHDGYEKNSYYGQPSVYPNPYDGSKVSSTNNQNTWDGRASVRWQPSSDTTIDIMADVSGENDRRVRGDKQMCHHDPIGIIGCLPDKLAFETPNGLGTFGTDFGSTQGITDVLAYSFGFPFASAQALGNSLGLVQLAGNGGPGDTTANASHTAAPGFGETLSVLGLSLVPNVAGVPFRTSNAILPGLYQMLPSSINGPGSNCPPPSPSNNNVTCGVTPKLLSTDTAFAPKYMTGVGTYTFNWAQTITSWLKSTLDLGYDNSYQRTFQNYDDGPPENIGPEIINSVTAFNALFDGPGGANQTGAYNTYFSVPGALPLSNTYYNGKFGSYGGIIDTAHGILTRTNNIGAYDQDNFSQREMTGELRFQTSFEGPLNFSAGAFWMSYNGRNQYWVSANTLDWDSIVLGSLVGNYAGSHLPLMSELSSYDGEYINADTQSRSMFLEGTYDIIPDELKVIVGARYNDDRSRYVTTSPAVGGQLLTNGYALVGTPSCTANGGAQVPGCVGNLLNFSVPTDLPGTDFGKSVVSTDLWTGRATVQWSPKLSWTDQTQVYATLSRGELAGGLNKTQTSAVLIVPQAFKPATVDSIEVGTKNTLLDGTLQANLDVWYYNYENYQVGIIANRAALEYNIPAHLYGMEGEFVWQPEDDLAFNLTLSLTRSQAGNSYAVDTRNPTGNVPGSILVRDVTNGVTCVVVPTTAPVGTTPADSNPAVHVNGFYLPQGGNPAADAPYGIPLSIYGICNPGSDTAPSANRLLLRAAGYDYSFATNPVTGAKIADPLDPTGFVVDGTGIAQNLHGNKLPDVPNAQVGIGGQYTFHLSSDYTLVPRVDYYWQSSMMSRVNNDSADYVASWDTMNGQIQLNAPDNKWYARVFATNIFDKQNPTGVYLTDPTSAMFTNVFAEDPRVIGVSVGANW